MKGHAALAAGLMTITIASPITAEVNDSRTTHAVQCLIAVSNLLDSENPTLKMSAMMATNFFTGQIFGMSPDIDLTAAIGREAPTLDNQRTQALLSQCGNEMASRGSQVRAAGDALHEGAPPADTKR